MFSLLLLSSERISAGSLELYLTYSLVPSDRPALRHLKFRTSGYSSALDLVDLNDQLSGAKAYVRFLYRL